MYIDHATTSKEEPKTPPARNSPPPSASHNSYSPDELAATSTLCPPARQLPLASPPSCWNSSRQGHRPCRPNCPDSSTRYTARRARSWSLSLSQLSLSDSRSLCPPSASHSANCWIWTWPEIGYLVIGN